MPRAGLPHGRGRILAHFPPRQIKRLLLSMHLGLDIGTSAVKGVVLDARGGIKAQAQAALAVSHPHPLWSEQNPDDWLAAVFRVCRALRKQNPKAYQKIAAAGLSGQMHGAVCLGADGKPLRPAILWDDGRAHEECQQLARAMPGIEKSAGVKPMPGFTAPKILWLKKHEAATYKKIRRILLPKDYARLALTGEFATDCADAAGTLWLNQKTRKWSPKLCAASQTDIAWLPKVYEGAQQTGALTKAAARKSGLPQGLPFAAGGGDAACGALGAGVVGHGDSFVSLGTSGQFFTARDSYAPPRGGMIHSFAHCVGQRWFLMAAMLNGARPLQWWSRVCNKPIAFLLSEAERADEKHLPLFLPYLTGERTPHNDARIRGGFYGLENNTARAQMTLSVLDAICFCFTDAARALSESGANPKRAAVVGGGARADFLLKRMSRAMRITLTRRESASTGPAIGAARLAMMMQGTPLQTAARKPKTEKSFPPGKEDAQQQERYLKWRKLYQTLRPFAQS